MLPLVAACILGMFNSFSPTLLSGFEQMQANPIDTRFNHYVLEHTFRCIKPGPYIGTFWSPPFFYPAEHTLAYSDNLLGAAPLYWVLRLPFAPSMAFSLWMIGCCVLCFATFAAFARRLKVHPFLIAAGAMLFAFGLSRSRLINHQQMLPQFATPLAVWAAWEWTVRPTLAKIAAVLGCIFVQFLCGIYLGWFLVLSLVPFIAVLLGSSSSRKNLTTFIRARWIPVSVLVAISAAVSVAVFWPYIRQQRQSGGYAWSEVRDFLPTLRTFLPPWQLQDSQANNLEFSMTVHPALPLGGIAFFAALVATLPMLRKRFRSSDNALALAMAGIVTAIVLILLSVKWPNGFSPWRAVYSVAPGARGIRAVSRIDLVICFYLTLTVMIGLDRLIRRISSVSKQHAVAVAIAIVLCAEQWVTGLPSFPTLPWETDVQELSDLMSAGGDVAYVEYYAPRNHA
ncbi:MAG TPA: hypothetical protein VGJ09_14685, partial [Bryobacteraceae bacterium]